MGQESHGGRDLTRKGLGQATGCNIETIRYYENIGVMPQAMRTASGYRVYGPQDVRRLAFILRLRKLGFSLGETRGFLELVDGHDYTCRKVHEITVAHVDDVNARIRDLQKIKRTLTKMAAECSRGEIPDCPIVDDLYG